MNKIVNKLLLVGAKSLPDFSSGSFVKDEKRIPKFIRTANTDYLYKNDLDKACFQHDTVYDKYKDLVKRTESKKVLRSKAFQIASNPTYNDYQRELASMVYKFLIKKSACGGVATLSKKFAIRPMPNQLQLANELHKPIIKKI